MTKAFEIGQAVEFQRDTTAQHRPGGGWENGVYVNRSDGAGWHWVKEAAGVTKHLVPSRRVRTVDERAAVAQLQRPLATPTRPPAEGPVPGLAEAARKAADALVTAQTIARVAHDSKHEDFFAAAWMALRRALAAEEERAKLRREAAEAWAAGRARGYQLTPQEIETIGRWAAAEPGSAP